jgi:hypothetical protein
MNELMKIPNSKFQNPRKFQTPNFKQRGRNMRRELLMFGTWTLFGIWILGFGISAPAAAAAAGKVLYQNDFSKGEIGKLPDEMLLLDGGFAVQDLKGNKVLQLPGAPLDTFGVLFGPTESANVAVSVRVHGTKKGRREPAFAVGLNGNAGYRLQISAAKRLIELYKGDEVVAKEPFTWESDSWTVLKLRTRKVKADEYVVEGKVWKHGATEPGKWTVSHVEKSEPNAGRASIWGNPFSGTPIAFDDLLVSAVP